MQNHRVHILLKEKVEEQGFYKIESPKYDESSYFMKQQDNLKIYLWSPEMVNPKIFRGIGLWIALDVIEVPISNIQGVHNIITDTNYFKTISFNKLYDDLPDEYRNIVNNVELIDEATISSVIEYMLHFIDTVYKPLWEKYSNLQVINDELIEKIPIDKLNEYISGTFFHGKMLIIMKKCRNPQYELFYKEQLLSFEESANNEDIKAALRSVNQDPELFSNLYLMWQDLYKYLESNENTM